jgi:multidrug efflux pump
MVLAIGLLIDDAIVVVENVERILDEGRLTPRDAARKSMDDISGALVGIALVLSAVLLPMAFYGGSIGVIYRQFSVTIVSAMLLSVLVALILSPALCAHVLKPRTSSRPEGRGPGARFNRGFASMTRSYLGAVETITAHKLLAFLVYGAIIVLLGFLFLRLPTGFLPAEDQGDALVQFTLPPGAAQSRTDAIRTQIMQYYLEHERRNVDGVFGVTGFSFQGQGQNAGIAFINLKPFDQRKGAENSVDAINARAAKALSKKVIDAVVFPLNLPPIQGLGQTSGFSFQLMNSTNMSRSAFEAARDRIVAAATADPTLTAVRANVLPDLPQLRINIDDAKLAALGLTEPDVITTLSSSWGSTYVNNFLDRGQIKRVYIQADAPYRRLPADLDNLYVRSSGVIPDLTRNSGGAQVTGGATGAVASTVAASATGVVTGTSSPFASENASVSSMVPFNAFATTSWAMLPPLLTRFNGFPSYEIDGDSAPGSSTGQAMQRIIALQQKLAPGTSFAWSGLSYQENISSGQGPGLYAVSVLVVFLALAALYESWSVPFAVLLVLPLGLIGAVAAVTLRGLDNNVYFQVGLLTTMGLAAKNAILIVEFAHMARLSGSSITDAAMQGARLRLRPILMTSLAFIVGTFPLAIATGAGAKSRIAIGTAVVGGVITGTVLAIFFTPMFFVVVSTLFHGHERPAPQPPEGADRPPETA